MPAVWPGGSKFCFFFIFSFSYLYAAMKIVYRNLKQGIVKLRIENLDDLWYLSTVVKQGDRVKTKTERRIKSKSDVLREKSMRETVTLGIEIEEVNFSEDMLRISGKIKEGPEDLISLGTHHTFNVQEGSSLRVTKKRWLDTELEQLKEAERASLRPKILILVIEEGECALGLLQESKIKYYDISKAIGGKYASVDERGKRKREFYQELGELILRTTERENISGVIISGPGFEPENFHKFFLEKNPDLKEKTFLEKISSSGRAGVKEVAKRPLMKKISKELGSAREIQLVNQLLREVGKDSGLGVYSLPDVKNAANLGAIENLLIGDDFFLKNREAVEGIIKGVRKRGGKFHFINHQGEAGQQLRSLGGIAAILRFKIS